MTIATMRRVLLTLDADWNDLCAEVASLAGPLPSWMTVGDHDWGLTGASRDLNDWAERARASDRLVGAALRAAQAGDRRAGRAVLHLLVPRLVGLASRDPHHELADYLAAAWLRLMTHPVDARPSALLTNLGMDALKQLSRAYERQHRPVPAGADWLTPPVADDGATAARLLTAARQAGWLSDRSEPVLRSVYCDGLSGREAARRHHTSPDMVRYRCSAGVKAMRAHREELLMAA